MYEKTNSVFDGAKVQRMSLSHKFIQRTTKNLQLKARQRYIHEVKRQKTAEDFADSKIMCIFADKFKTKKWILPNDSLTTPNSTRSRLRTARACRVHRNS